MKKGLLIILGMGIVIVVVIWGIFAATDPQDNLIIVESRFTTDETGSQIIAGTIENTTNRPFSNVKVSIELIDESGTVMASTSTTRNELGPKQTGTFQFPVNRPGVITFRVDVTSPDNVRPAWLGGGTQ
jgi:hypothetical protein